MSVVGDEVKSNWGRGRVDIERNGSQSVRGIWGSQSVTDKYECRKCEDAFMRWLLLFASMVWGKEDLPSCGTTHQWRVRIRE